MKFGKQFEFYKIPEWSEFYFDYNGIKTVIKFLDKRRAKKKQLKKIKSIKKHLRKLSTLKNIENINEINTNSREEDILINQSQNIEIDINDQKPLLQPEKINEHDLVKREKIMEAEDLSGYTNEEKLTKFLKIYREKIAVVNEFFTKKLEEFENKLENSKRKMIIKNRTLLRRDSVERERVNIQQNAERDEMGYAVSWKRALSTLYNETSWLHSYQSINTLAIKKIQKKIKKIFKLIGIMDIETKLNDIDNEFSFFIDSDEKLINLRKKNKKSICC